MPTLNDLVAAEADCKRMQAEIERLRAVVYAAILMPRTTPRGGAASTKHTYQIAASSVWALDAALKALNYD